jgi:hypothetical protein
MGRRIATTMGIALGIMLVPSAAFACGGLVSANGTVNLAKTTTLAAYVDGVERYVTSFTYTGSGGGKFGSIVPLPAEPTSVKRAGDWTLQRLVREVAPPVQGRVALAFAAADSVTQEAQVILETRIDALDITVVKGGADEVALWATNNGFELSPDAPEVLDFYANRSPYFMAARFDATQAARLGQTAGDGTPIMVTMPTDDPWVPLRILALGRRSAERIEADVFLLTERAPVMLPAPQGTKGPGGLPTASGLEQVRSEPANELLLSDLRSDKNMKWLPTDGLHFSYIKVDAAAGELGHDLAIDASGAGEPSWVDAGFPVGIAETAEGLLATALAWTFGLIAVALALTTIIRSRRVGLSV